MMRLVREIVFIMNACDFFTILAYLFYKCLRILANAVANHANVLRTKLECNTWVLYLVCIIHIRGVLLRLISAWSCLISLFPSNLD